MFQNQINNSEEEEFTVKDSPLSLKKTRSMTETH